MTDDEPKLCESVRFWRLNSLEALRFMPRLETNPERFPRDEEHQATMQANSAEYNGLLARENAVRRRYNAIFKANLPEAKK